MRNAPDGSERCVPWRDTVCFREVITAFREIMSVKRARWLGTVRASERSRLYVKRPVERCVLPKVHTWCFLLDLGGEGGKKALTQSNGKQCLRRSATQLALRLRNERCVTFPPPHTHTHRNTRARTREVAGYRACHCAESAHIALCWISEGTERTEAEKQCLPTNATQLALAFMNESYVKRSPVD